MKRTKTAAFLLAALLLLATLAACSGTPAAAGPVTVTDMKGREVTLPGPATRIVSVNPADCEILYAIGAGGALVGRGVYCDYPEAVLELPAVESGAELNTEQVMALSPDVILMPAMNQTEEQVQAFADIGAAVVVSDAQDIESVYEAIALMGAITGKTAEAEALASGMRADFAALAPSAGTEGKSVYFEVSPLEFGLWTAGRGTFMDELATMLGLRNVFGDLEGWPQISEEQVLERDPDIIITVAMFFGEGQRPEDEIMGRPGWQALTAVQNGAVYNVDNNEIARPGPRLADAAKTLYALAYGEAPAAA